MASRTQSTYEAKQAKTKASQDDSMADLCAQYRVIGIAAVAAAASVGKTSPGAG